MDIEAMKQVAKENLKTNEENRNQAVPTAPGSEGTKPSQEVAKKIADAAGPGLCIM